MVTFQLPEACCGVWTVGGSRTAGYKGALSDGGRLEAAPQLPLIKLCPQNRGGDTLSEQGSPAWGVWGCTCPKG